MPLRLEALQYIQMIFEKQLENHAIFNQLLTDMNAAKIVK